MQLVPIMISWLVQFVNYIKSFIEKNWLKRMIYVQIGLIWFLN